MLPNFEILVTKNKFPNYLCPITSRKLERAFNENLIETYLKIVKYSPKNARKYLSLYLLRFEIEQHKGLIKATSAKLSPEQKLTKIYFSVEDYFKRRRFMEEAAKASISNPTNSCFERHRVFFMVEYGA